MPSPPLSAQESAALTQASGMLERGAATQAAGILSPLIDGGSRHPDLLFAFSAACEQLGLFPNAIGAAEAALQQSPERADLWAHLGRMLHDQGRSAEGVNLLERAVALEPDNGLYWYNLGLAALSAGLLGRVQQALQRAIELEPAHGAAWGALGLAQQQNGALDQSEQSLRKALKIDPRLLSAAHNLAITLRLLDRPSDALTVLDEAMQAGLAAVETKTLHAHLLGDLGRLDEAVQSYRTIIAETPIAIDAQETLARLLPQLGRGDEALSEFAAALGKTSTLELYRSALNTAWELKDAVALERWSKDAQQRFGTLPNLKMMEGLASGIAGGPVRALAVLEPLASAGFAPVLAHCAYYRLRLGDLKEAEGYALAATRAYFTDQTAWAYLTVIWRLLEDPREQWLADYDRFVMPTVLPAPNGFDDIASFMGALAQELNDLHLTVNHPADQSLRHGTQTRGSLFDKRTPLVRQLAAVLEPTISNRIAELPIDDAHPFLSRNTRRARYAGSWSVRLRSGGFHVSHIHQHGWLSSALYVALPSEESGQSKQAAPPGSLAFGIPDRELGLDLTPRRVEIPEVGKLVLFPSYFWHGTIPFESEEQRLTVAFDAVPD